MAQSIEYLIRTRLKYILDRPSIRVEYDRERGSDANPIHVQHYQDLTEKTFSKDIMTRGHKIARFMDLVDFESSMNADSDWLLKACVKHDVSCAIEVWLAKFMILTVLQPC